MRDNRGEVMEIATFLGAFFGPEDIVHIRVFSDKKPSKFSGKNYAVPMNVIDKYTNMLMKHNKENRGVFFVVNYGGNVDKDITRVNAHFVECDKASIEEQQRRIKEFPLEPSIIVQTRKSLHVYWLIKDGSLSLFRNIQKRLAQYFDGDRSIINESRVLRIPGFDHCKEEPIRVKAIKFNPEIKYTQEELVKCLPELERNHEREISRGGRNPEEKKKMRGIKKVIYGCDFMKYCKENPNNLPEYHWYAMITNLAVFKEGNEAIHELSSPYEGYSRRETEEKIKHFIDSGTKPMTCVAIGEKGYRCEKLMTNRCTCKSPATLAYRGISIDVVREILKGEKRENDVTKDLLKAAAFVEEYVLELEELAGTSLITNDIKEYYKFKETHVKALMKKYRQLYSRRTNKRNENLKLKVAKEKADEMPPWYEVTEKGQVKFMPGILAAHMKENVHGFYGAEEFYLYKNGVYNEVNELIAAKVVRKHLIDKYTTMNGINDALGQWQILSYKQVRFMNPDPYIINLKNGLYNVRKNKLIPHNPNYLSTVQIKATYNRNAECPLFMNFLKDSLGEEEIVLVQEILGYLLIPINKAQKSFVFVGAGNAGKSTLLSVAQEILLGNNNVSNVPWQALSDRFKTAELFGKLANIFADLPSKSIDDNGIFKSITGEDYLTVEKKNKAPFSFRPYARLLFSCNDIPKNYGDKSNAFYRRLIIIRFEKPVPMEKRDTSLKEKLQKEADGILLWALEGLTRLIDNNYIFSESSKSKKELEKYRIESNSTLSFVMDNCTLDINRAVELKELYREYTTYCEESGINAVSLKRFSKELQENYETISLSKDTLSRRTVLRGISH